MRNKLLVCVGLLAACGEDLDGPDLSGVYQVTTAVESDADCNPTTPIEMPDPYFILESKELFGHTYFHHAGCPTADPASCEEFGSLGPLDSGFDGGWEGGLGFAVGSMPPCTLGYSYGSATVIDDTTVQVEDRSYIAEDQPTCDANEATERGTSLPCVSSKRWVGTRVADI
ncbi:MAG: hypothetical protein AB7P03_26120 [Kofleriaceae bacterium]